MCVFVPDLVPDRSIPVPDLLELTLSPSPRCEADDLGLAMAPVKIRVQGRARTLLYQRRGSLGNVGCKGEPSVFLTRGGFAFSTECKCIKRIYIYIYVITTKHKD